MFSDCLGHERQHRSGLAAHAQGYTASHSGQPLEVSPGYRFYSTVFDYPRKDGHEYFLHNKKE